MIPCVYCDIAHSWSAIITDIVSHGIDFALIGPIMFLQVYSPGAEDMMSHPGDSIPQSHYSPKGTLYGDSYYMGRCTDFILMFLQLIGPLLG